MAAYFLDTSAVVKRYVQETGTIWVQALADLAAGHFLYVARITDVEMMAAMARRRRLGSLSPAQSGQALNAFRQDCAQQYRIVEITIPLIQEASRLAHSHVLRAYDAVQLAAALDIHRLDPSLTLLTADAELKTTAIAEGLTVDDPTAIPSPDSLSYSNPHDEEPEQRVRSMLNIAAEFAVIDPDSFAHRYPIDPKGKRSTAPDQTVNLEAFPATMSQLLHELEVIHFGIDIETDIAQDVYESILCDL